QRTSEENHDDGFSAKLVSKEAEPDIANNGTEIVAHSGICGPGLRWQPGLARGRSDEGRHPSGDAPPRNGGRQRHQKSDYAVTANFRIGKQIRDCEPRQCTIFLRKFGTALFAVVGNLALFVTVLPLV